MAFRTCNASVSDRTPAAALENASLTQSDRIISREIKRPRTDSPYRGELLMLIYFGVFKEFMCRVFLDSPARRELLKLGVIDDVDDIPRDSVTGCLVPPSNTGNCLNYCF